MARTGPPDALRMRSFLMKISMRLPQVLSLLIGTLAFSLQAATITVNSLGDSAANDGACTLREAIIAANTDASSGAMAGECAAGSGSDAISFSVAGVIKPGSGGLPGITTVMHIDGYTAPGASKNTQPLAQGTNAVLKIEIDGVDAGNSNGLSLLGPTASGTIIEGLAINNSGPLVCCGANAIFLSGVNGLVQTVLRGNFLGTNVAGTLSSPRGGRMIYLEQSANVIIGTTQIPNDGPVAPAAVNLISGSSLDGITVSLSTNVQVRGNLIGTNAAGSLPLPNAGYGILLEDTSGDLVLDNVISASGKSGIILRGASSGVQIAGNTIGLNAAGTGPLPNNLGGILVAENPLNHPGNDISNVDIINNVVAHNTCAGDCAGITVGARHPDNIVKGIHLTQNRVFSNKGLEIDLGETDAGAGNILILGVTANDDLDPDSGGNTLQNFPVLTSAVGDGTNVSIDFTLNSEANKSFTLEFFHTATCDPSGHGGAEKYLGSGAFATKSGGVGGGSVVLALSGVNGFITATATNVLNGTSEFSACAAVVSDVIFMDGFEAVVP